MDLNERAAHRECARRVLEDNTPADVGGLAYRIKLLVDALDETEERHEAHVRELFQRGPYR